MSEPTYQKATPPIGPQATGMESKEGSQSASPPAFQLKAESSGPPPAQLKANTGGMPADLSNGFAASTGHDLSNVNVHYNSAAPSQVGALAYAQGNDIHLGPGQEKHLSHEAAHVVQQREGRVQANTSVGGKPVNDDKGLESEADSMGAKAMQMMAAPASPAVNNAPKAEATQLKAADAPVQRLIKASYPWEGVIANCSIATLRSSPSMDPKNPIAWPPAGTKVTVLSETKGWLEVTLTLGAKTHTGYVYNNLVDDPVAASMKSMLGKEATWVPSGPNSGDSFQLWASAPTEAAAPELKSSTTINCWEVVLLAAYRAGKINWAWIHDLYVNKAQATWVSSMASSTAAYTPGVSKPQRGDIVFWNGLDHVALATGNGDEIMSFWPPPDKESYENTIDKVKTTSIQALTDYITKTWGAPTVTFGAGTW